MSFTKVQLNAIVSKRVEAQMSQISVLLFHQSAQYPLAFQTSFP